ncbi:DUF1553 domain-containing protein [Thalassoroseus pseudoceratinae]|uniref:DUF1553 domain-containing protein n=1 Tax=Thalassoroseus pseudoceratinae TaxID=2713176 RepID=UPI00141F4A81|nr:DUF1553 domain-containing protein [Thalassoroseus pseudoceratinae]
MNSIRLFPLSLIVCVWFAHVVTAAEVKEKPQEPSREEVKFFENEIRPLLAKNCYKCHGEEKQKGGLRLDGIGSMLVGGESGSPSVVPGKPDESMLIEAVRWDSYEMPPSGRLDDAEVAKLTKWVELGAPWPGGHGSVSDQPVRPVEKITEEDRQWWAFQPVTDPAVPELENDEWCRTDIDRFVLRKLREHKLSPAKEADRETLIRRVTLDLTGLPPTPEEIAAFVNDPSSDAYERLVDSLLESPRYGERAAVQWLDLVRYAESDGYRQDAYRPHAWRYRDYVIRSFNDDKPYDQFVTEQLAGDEVAPGDADALVATGFLRHWVYEYNQRDCRTQWDVIVTDMTDVTGDVFLGMGMGCARCHDHKFDPILQKDYFALRAFLAPVLPRDDVPAADAKEREEYNRQLAVWEAKTASIREEMDQLRFSYRRNAKARAVEKFPPDIRKFMKRPESEWTPLQRQLADLVLRQVITEEKRAEAKLKDEEKKRIAELEKQLAQFDDIKPKPLPAAITVTDVGAEAPTVTIPGKKKLGEIEPAFLTVLDPAEPDINPPAELESTGRRTALAKWITDPENPLSTRVIVNRIWQQHFGRGIVETASDFGHLGEKPTHPELLDWLTKRFLEDGWRIKPLHRRIVMSAAYRQSSFADDTEAAEMIDAENKFLWRQNVRRMEAEQVRDAILAVTGELDEKMGGSAVSGKSPRRSVYTQVKRNSPDPLLAAFDGAMRITSTPNRNVTTTPTQALLLINGDWTVERARKLAGQLEQIARSKGLATAIERAYKLTFGRSPREVETQSALAFLESQRRLAAEAAKNSSSELKARLGKIKTVNGESAALDLRPAEKQGRLVHFDSSAISKSFPSQDFTIEAVIQLRSLYADASVRTIASRWNNTKQHAGWSLGVTSTRSGYKPRNLILQIVGHNGQGQMTYEVVASNLRPELNKPYYVAASVDVSETGKQGITFYLKDLSVADAPLQMAHVAHKVVSLATASAPLILGGRAETNHHRWDGLLDSVRLSAGVLPENNLAVNSASPAKSAVAVWNFDGQTPLVDHANQHKLAFQEPSRTNVEQQALVDFCHVLLNTNEFLYID